MYEGESKDLLTSPTERIAFIPKPVGKDATAKIAAIARCVDDPQGKLLELDFADPHFIFHLHEALRLGLITTQDQLIAPIELYCAYLEYGGFDEKSTRRFRCDDEKGPHPLAKWPTALPADMPLFQKELKQIPESQRVYYTVDLTHQQAVGMLHILLARLEKLDNYREFLKKYLSRFDLTSLDKKVLQELDSAEYLSQEAGTALYGFVCNREPYEVYDFHRRAFLDDAPELRVHKDFIHASLTDHHRLFVAFFFEIFKNSPERFASHVAALGLSAENAEKFINAAKTNHWNLAAFILCGHWQSTVTLDDKPKSTLYKILL